MNIHHLPETAKPIYIEMSREFSNVSYDELKIYHIMGKKDFRKLINVAFEYAYQKAKFFGIDQKSKKFIELCQSRRRQDVTEILRDIEFGSKLGFKPSYEPFNEEEIINLIKEECINKIKGYKGK
ncbi:MAG: hypothetical protein Q8L29_04095 [archaeon]|nr:hypothetical protein [archaeon]